MKLVKLLFIVFFVLIGAAFAVMNAEQVILNYYFGNTQLPLSLVLIAFMAIGAALGIIACSSIMMRLKHENSGLKRKAKMVKEEVNNLRTIPLRDQ
ncbi:MAG: LapA family protein [Chromatiales bacterium]